MLRFRPHDIIYIHTHLNTLSIIKELWIWSSTVLATKGKILLKEMKIEKGKMAKCIYMKFKTF